MAKAAGSTVAESNGYLDDFSGADFGEPVIIGGEEGIGEAKREYGEQKRTRKAQGQQARVQAVRSTSKAKKLETQLALLLQMTSYGAAFLLKNKHIEMEQTVNSKGERNPTEALTIAKPLALMLLESPWADTFVKLAETSASGSALVMAVVAYVARVTMATMMDKMTSEDMPAELGAMMAQMMGGLQPVVNAS